MIFKKAVLVLLLAICLSAQTCPMLCASTCSGTTCPSCYSSFIADAPLSTSCPTCPDGMFEQTTNSTSYCAPCPITCLTCTNSNICKTCISGFLLSNSFKCIAGALTATGWVSKNISSELTNGFFVASDLSVQLNGSTTNGTFLSYLTSCSKLSGFSWLGGYNQFGFTAKLIKSVFSLSVHQWANLRFHVLLVDQTQNNTLIVELNTQDSYSRDTMENPKIIYAARFNSSIRKLDFCGNNSIPDNLAIVDAWTPHNLSSLKFRIRLNESDSNNLTNSTKVFFGIRELFIRVGTCGRNCRFCSSPTQCSQCDLPYELVNGSCVCSGTYGFPALQACSRNCIAGEYYNNTANSCYKCEALTADCMTCEGRRCLTCQLGYFLVDDGDVGSCIKECPDGWGGKRNAVRLVRGLAVVGDLCVSCPANCRSCNGNICLFCSQNYNYYQGACLASCPTAYTSSQGLCRKCPPNCNSCSSPTTCSTCSSSFQLVSGSCLPQCAGSTILASSTNNTCNITCSTSCLYCSGSDNSSCTACASGSVLSGGSCVSTCPAGTYNSNGKCLGCQEDCSVCTSSISCSSCRTGFYLLGTSCLRQCPASRFPQSVTASNVTSNLCSLCQTGCLTCLDATSCLSCSVNYILFNFTCLTSPPIGYYYSISHGYYLPCEANCDQCDRLLCQRCSSGWLLDSGSCVSECPPQKYRKLTPIANSSAFSGSCIWKSPLCEVYNANSSDGSCSQCSYTIPALILQSVGNTKQCLLSCPDFSVRTFNSSSCVSCPNNCRYCSAGLRCYECLYNYVVAAIQTLNATNVFNSTCVPNYCMPPYFTDSLQCQLCPAGCLVCQIDGGCYQCSANLTVASDGRTCITASCGLAGFSNSSGQCQSCSATCRSCVGSSTACSSCPLASNSSLQTYLLSSSCSSTCPDGYFKHFQSLSCRKCDPKCSTCASFRNCLTCTQGFSLLDFYDLQNARCVRECPVGFWSGSGVCQRCQQDCQSCYGPSEYQCLSCYANFNLDEGKCVYTCLTGKFADAAGYCEYCDPACQQCYGPTADNCFSCKQNYYLAVAEHRCYANQCPDATYLAIPSLRQCENCQFGCSVCNSPQFCRYCFSGYYLYRGWCYLTCPPTTSAGLKIFPYIYGGIPGGYCSKCSAKYTSNCRFCDQTKCKSCNNGYYLYPPGNTSTIVNGSTIYEMCFPSCPAQTYANNYKCQACPTNCLACTAQSCTSCSSGFNLINGYCSADCPSPKYLAANNTCASCLTGCASCTNSINCTSCISGYSMFVNSTAQTASCVQTCPLGYFADASGWCSRCPSTCAACSSATSCSNCTAGYTLTGGACQSGTNSTVCSSGCLLCTTTSCLQCNTSTYLLVNSNGVASCVAVCPQGYFSAAGTCQKCLTPCSSCIGSSSNCTSCSSGLYLLGSSCVAACPLAYYASSSSRSCQPCPSNCLNCQATTCTTCRSGFWLYQGSCVATCPTGTYQSQGGHRCRNCSSGCASCSDDDECTSCVSPLALYKGLCVAACPQGYYMTTESSTSVCRPCVSPCFTCSSASACTTCISTYILNGTTCQANCNAGYYSSARTVTYDQEVEEMDFSQLTQCFPCSQACLTCSNSQNNCQTCAATYWQYGSQCLAACPAATYPAANNTCQRCPNFCLTCTNATSCQICSGSTSLMQGSCVSPCPQGYYSSETTSGKVCQPCAVGCRSCSGPSQYDCTSCLSGYYSYKGMCVRTCPDGFYPATTGTCQSCPYSCLTCVSASNCTTCRTNYALTASNQCSPNSNTTVCTVANCLYCVANSTTSCAQCSSPYNLVNATCSQSCPSGSYSLSGICTPCPSNCLVCTSAGCSSCNNVTYLYLGNCYSTCPSNTLPYMGSCISDPCISYDANGLCLKCLAPYLLTSSANNASVQCVSGCPDGSVQVADACKSCPASCVTCLSTVTCTQCSNGTYLYQGTCRTICPIGSYPSAGSCVPCSLPYCLACSTNSNGSLGCSQCDSSASLWEGSCVVNCPAGTYSDNGICVSCGSGCSACVDATTCTACQSGFYFSAGRCLPNCPSSTYALNSSGLLSCAPCSSNCYACTSANTCSTCQPGFSLWTYNATTSCVSSCPSGSYSISQPSTSFPNSNQPSCSLCVSPCLTCYSATSCASCISGYFYLQGSCVATCPDGYFSSSLAGNSSLMSICSPCSPTCQKCSGSATSCTSCPSGYLLDSSGNCNSNCASPNTYYANSTCGNCSSSCYSCSGPAPNNCLSCQPPLQLYGTSCLPTCPITHYPTSAYICQPCASVCATCSVSASNCTSCPGSLTLQTTNDLTTCVTVCSTNYYLNSSSLTCQPCSVNCLACSGPAATQCTACPSGRYLSAGSCLPSCPSGTVAVITNGQGSCSNCPPGCLSCTYSSSTQSASCTQCTDGLFLYSGSCYQTCPATTYSSMLTYTCQNCAITGCLACLISAQTVNCTLCQAGYLLLESSGTCVKDCPSGYIADGNRCVVKPICVFYTWQGFCIPTCPSGTYPNTVGGIATCSNCSVGCSSCSSSSSCSVCTSGVLLTQLTVSVVNGSSLTIATTSCVNFCPNGYYAQNGQCQQCPSSCLTCQLSADSVICLSCPGTTLLLNEVCVTVCPTGFFSSGSTCSPCSSGCASCNGSATNCTLCKNANFILPACNTSNCSAGSYPAVNGSCQTCKTGCLTCFGSGEGECTSCATSYFLQSGQCLPNCPSGSVANGSICAPCPSNCLTCFLINGQTSCSSCVSPYLLVASTGQCTSSCAAAGSNMSSYYLSGGQCQLCNLTNCLGCAVVGTTTQCQMCTASTFYYQGQCYTSCPNATYSSTNPNACQPCPTNCALCTSSGCVTCASGYSLLSGSCVANCPSGYYSLVNGSSSSCQSCSSNCLNCTSGSSCSACRQPYQLNTNNQCNGCMDGYYYTNTSTCNICSPTCLTCSTSSLNCVTCPSGSVLFNATCLANCPSGYYLSSTGCLPCSTANCQTCPNNTCSNCQTGYVGVLSASGVLSCQSTCPSASFLYTVSNQCVNCSTNCSSCTSATQCLTCQPPSSLYLGYCISSCPSGYFPSNGTCQVCQTNCKVCSSLSNCSACQSGYQLVSNGSCTAPTNNCSTGYYLNSQRNCSQCFASCLTCIGPLSSQCTACTNGLVLQNGVCQTCNSSTYYSNTSGCVPCSSIATNCLTCSSTQCNTCAVGYQLQGNTCAVVCPDGTFSSGGQCTSCSSYCLVCNSTATCQQCLNSSYLLIQGQCLTQCPNQTYLAGTSCQSCPQTCQTCVSSSNCSSCLSPYLLWGASCVISCPNSTYTSTGSCQSCSTNCLLCTDANTCTSCNGTYLLTNGTCRTSCASGQYLDAASRRCIQCVLPCLNCTSRTSCSSCQSPALLSNSSCISNCSAGTYYNSSFAGCTNCTLPNCGYCTASGCSTCLPNYFSTYIAGVLAGCNSYCLSGFYADPVSMNCSSCFSRCAICNNASSCRTCTTGYLLLGGTSVNECVRDCPLGYYASNNTCQACSSNCNWCSSSSTCTVCAGYYYLLAISNQTKCVTDCPIGYYTPSLIDGNGKCGPCNTNCLACLEDSTCTSCVSSSFVIYNGDCIPTNCINCELCLNSTNQCQKCSANYYLYNSACRPYCPNGYYADNATRSCMQCITDCLACSDGSTCLLCITGSVFVNGTGCVNEGYLNYGAVGNMSGFTSNITEVVATIYVSTSAGPIAFGALTSTYGPMQFCQFLYLLQGSTGGNEQMNTFLNSLSIVSYTVNPNNANSTNSSTSSASARRRLTSIEYTSSFLQTNVPIFLMMLGFICSYITVRLLEKYSENCCQSCPTLLRYVKEICDFMGRRFKWVYVDCMMWISYLPFLYFSILQLQSLKFGTGLEAISTIIAILIIIVYPLYPLLILRVLFDKSDKPEENLKNYKMICLLKPLDEEEANKPMCEGFECCPKAKKDEEQNINDVAINLAARLTDIMKKLTEMSLSPYIEKVVRPVYNEESEEYGEFRYFKLEHWRLAYAAIKYFRKFLFVLIVALCPNPVATLSILVVLSAIYITYLAVLKPKEKLYLVLEIILQSVLVFFLLFMLIYVGTNGATVGAMSVATHAIGFVMANSTLIIAIILNIMAYYTIFCCIVDLVKHLKEKAEYVDEKEKLDEMIDEKEKYMQLEKDLNIERDNNDDDHVDHHLDKDLPEGNDKEIGLRKTNNRKRDDDEMTVENNNDEDVNYDPLNLDEKEFNVRSSMMKKKTYKDSVEDQIPDLRMTQNKPKRRHSKKVALEDESHTSEEMGNSKITEEEVENGLIKDRENNKYKRQIGKDKVNVDKGELKESTDKYRRHRKKPEAQQPLKEQESLDYFISPDAKKKKETEEYVEDVHTHDRIMNKPKFIDPMDSPDMYERPSKRKSKKDTNEDKLGEGIMRERDPKSKNESQKDIEGINTYERELKAKKQMEQKRAKQLEELYLKEREKAKRQKDPFGEFADHLENQERQEKIREQQMIDRNRKAKEKAEEAKNINKEQLHSDFLVDPSFINREPAKKPQNKHYKGSDEENELGEVETKERKKGDHRRNVRHQAKKEEETDINATGKDINTKKMEKIQSNKEFAEDSPENIKFREREAKLQKIKSTDPRVQDRDDLEEIKGYEREKKGYQKKGIESNISDGNDLDNVNTFERQKNQAKKDNKGYFDAMKGDELVESIVIEPEIVVRKPRNNEDFEEEDIAGRNRRKQELRSKIKDNKMQISGDYEEDYEEAIKKNKQQVFKQDTNKKSGLLDLEEDNDFEESNYVRPESKVDRSRSRSKDMGLGVRNESDVSEDDSKSVRKGRSSAIQRLRKKAGTLNVNDSEQQDTEKVGGADSRRVSKIANKRKKTRGGNLNIQDNSESEDIQQIGIR